MRNLTILLLLILIALPAPNVAEDWDLDSRDSLFLMETDYFYLSLIPENDEVVVGVVGTGVEPGLSELDPFIYSNPDEVVNGYDTDENSVIDDMNGASFLHNFNETTNSSETIN